MTDLSQSGDSALHVGWTPDWDMDWVYRNVALLPLETLAQLATGPRFGWDCTVCRVLNSSPENDSPFGRLMRWHQEPQDVSRFGIDGPRQDPARCGVIYGIAKALVVQALSTARSEGD